jgi:alpha-methylacyl-CoA racemase
MGPLAGVRVVEIAGIGPGPFAAMVLADMGADVLRVDRIPERVRGGNSRDVLNRGRPSAGVDLKHPRGVETVLALVERADALIEGFRPGVMERLGLGPDACLARNPRLLYGRITGWGQDGPLAESAGHDIDYIALAGALHAIGRAGATPVPPLNLVGDFGGGGMLMAFGIVCGLVERSRSGKGQVVDASMVDGAALLMSMFFAFRAAGGHSTERGTNLLDGGAPFYDTYETADGKYVAVGALEPKFYAELIERLGLSSAGLPAQMDRAGWPVMRAKFAEVIRTKTRDEWCALLEGTDACFAPILDIEEAARHPHNRARGTFVEVDGVLQPAPAPRFSRTAAGVPTPPPRPAADTDAALGRWGFAAGEITALRASGAIG